MNQQELYRHIEENRPNICQIIILQNGKEIYSAEWNGYQRNDCTHIMSATKSIMALLTGIAIDHGMIGSVDEKVLSSYFKPTVFDRVDFIEDTLLSCFG